MYPFEYPNPTLSEYGIEFFVETRKMGRLLEHHSHSAIEFIYIKRGIFDVMANNKTISVLPGDLVLFHAHTVHALMPKSEDAIYYVLKMSSSFLFSMLHKNSIPHVLPFLKNQDDDLFCFPGDTLPTDIRRVWESMIQEYDANDPTCYAMERILSCEFILRLSRLLEENRKETKSSTSELSDRAVKLITDNVNYINGHFHLPLTASECAARTHLSYGHYAKLFRSVMGKSFKEYLTNLRMTKAYNMLLSSDLPVSEIAMACGYENLSYFIAEFKKVYHLTPSQLRKQTQGQ